MRLLRPCFVSTPMAVLLVPARKNACMAGHVVDMKLGGAR